MTCLNNEQIKKLEKQASNDEYRLNYHLMPPTGWLNDPMDYVSLKGFIIFTINMHQTIALEVINIGDIIVQRILLLLKMNLLPCFLIVL